MINHLSISLVICYTIQNFNYVHFWDINIPLLTPFFDLVIKGYRSRTFTEYMCQRFNFHKTVTTSWGIHNVTGLHLSAMAGKSRTALCDLSHISTI